MSETTKKILFVEDEPVAQAVYRNRLEREGFEIFFAENGEMALDALSQGAPDLIVLDLMLPQVNGVEMLRHIRSELGLKGTPVLVLSNAYVSGLSQQAVEAGATRGLLKTDCTPARLVAAVRDMLGYAPPFGLSNKPASDETQAQAFIAAAREAHADEMSLKQTRDEFVKEAPGEVAKMRESVLACIQGGGAPETAQQLDNLYQQVRFFATRAGMSGCPRVALVASAFEALLFDIASTPEKINASICQTIAQAVDCLERLCQRANAGGGEVYLKAKVLVTGDADSNFAIVSALQRANFEPESAEDSSKALQMAQATHYDLILLDIHAPGVNGFELCQKLRRMTEYKETPVIFITASGDFQNRAQSILNGGNDLIPKPVSHAELVLKATMRRLQPQMPWSETSTAAAAQRLMSQQNIAPSAPVGNAPILVESPLSRVSQSASHESQKALAHFPPHPQSLSPTGEREEAECVRFMGREQVGKEQGTFHETPAEPLVIKMADSETPPAPAVVNGENAEIDTAFLAWPEMPVEPHKPAETVKAVDSAKVIERITPLEIEDPLPKIEVPTATDFVPPPIPSIQMAKETAIPLQTEPPVTAGKLTTAKPVPEPHKSPNMETKTRPNHDEATRGVARLIFGDENATDMNVRLTRIVLERYNFPGTPNLDEVARGVAQIVFGDDKVNEMSVRLMRIALERYLEG